MAGSYSPRSEAETVVSLLRDVFGRGLDREYYVRAAAPDEPLLTWLDIQADLGVMTNDAARYLQSVLDVQRWTAPSQTTPEIGERERGRVGRAYGRRGGWFRSKKTGRKLLLLWVWTMENH